MKPLKNPTVHTASRAEAQVGEPLCSVGIFKMETPQDQKTEALLLTCNTCKQTMNSIRFMKDRSQSKGHNPTCKQCVIDREYKKFKHLIAVRQKMLDELYVDYDGEYWVDMVDYEDYYQISNYGRIYSKKAKRRIRPSLVHGYFRVPLLANKVRKTRQVHRMVAKTFIQNPKNLPFVNHKDGCGINNHVDNLEWCDHSHNIQHSYDNGRIQPRSVPVVAINIKTGEKTTFPSMNKLRIKLRIKTMYVQQVLRGEKVSHSGWQFILADKPNKKHE